jgi:hypothetical protein
MRGTTVPPKKGYAQPQPSSPAAPPDYGAVRCDRRLMQADLEPFKKIKK